MMLLAFLRAAMLIWLAFGRRFLLVLVHAARSRHERAAPRHFDARCHRRANYRQLHARANAAKPVMVIELLRPDRVDAYQEARRSEMITSASAAIGLPRRPPHAQPWAVDCRAMTRYYLMLQRARIR